MSGFLCDILSSLNKKIIIEFVFFNGAPLACGKLSNE